MDRLFLDANVFFSATYSCNGASFWIFELGKAGRLEIYSSMYALNEAKVNVERKIGEERLVDFYRLVSLVKRVDRSDYLNLESDLAELIKEKYLPILEGARGIGVDFLITLDKKDFLTKKVLEAGLGFEIMLPGDYLKLATN